MWWWFQKCFRVTGTIIIMITSRSRSSSSSSGGWWREKERNCHSITFCFEQVHLASERRFFGFRTFRCTLRQCNDNNATATALRIGDPLGSWSPCRRAGTRRHSLGKRNEWIEIQENVKNKSGGGVGGGQWWNAANVKCPVPLLLLLLLVVENTLTPFFVSRNYIVLV